eukprot:TRINITY_DN32434_c0_g1_i1.p2 TRINITY_DN32434_c0_g1~~TRINITY_DN32434_c0_g1_i1.p2  ORF type:complete len:658 (+),score=250.02 TRINITY_DN32434_c0_g1_i1:90-2063(+)
MTDAPAGGSPAAMPCGAVDSGAHLWRGEGGPKPTALERDVAGWHVEMRKQHLAQAVLLALRGTNGAVVRAVVDSPAGGQAEGEGRMDMATLQSLSFRLCDGVDADTQAYLAPLLEMAADRAVVYRFAKHLTVSFAHGVVNQALGAGLLDVCLGVHELVCDVWDELDKYDPVTVVHQRMVPYRHLLSLAREVTTMHALNMRGAEVLKCLEQADGALSVRCPDGGVLVKALFHHAAAPLLRLVEAWLFRGELSESALAELPLVTSTSPAEVLAAVGRGQVCGDDSFMDWTFDATRLPAFMQPSADALLQCGKLAMVLRKAGVLALADPAAPPRLRAHREEFTAAVTDAWREANTAVLALLRDHGLDRFVGFVHKYYLCGAAGWVADVVDRCRAKATCSLSRTAKEVNWTDLQNVLLAASDGAAAAYGLRFDVAASQFFRCLRGKPLLHAELPLMNALQLSACVQWPLSLVFPPQVFAQYNFVFRLLFRIKALRGELLRCTRGRRGRRAGDGPIRLLLYAMLSFLTSLETYVSFEVVEPAFDEFRAVLKAAETVQELVEAQAALLRRMLHQCLAHNEPTLKLLEMVFLSVKLFSEAARHDIPGAMVDRFTSQFVDRVQELLVAMEAGCASGDGVLLQHLLRRLDFNGFYQRLRERARAVG